MSFGEAYQGMSDREILIEVAMDVRHQSERTAAQGIHLEKLEQKVDAIQCPSPRCQDHAHRLGVLEIADQGRKNAWGPRTAWVMVALSVIAIVISTVALLYGG